MANKTQKTTLIGSILSALLASVCCLGPIIFAFLGISGAGLVLKFEAYRPIFIVVAVALLGVAGYLTYRRKPPEECAPDTYCATPRSARVNKILFWTAMIAVVLAIFSPTILGWLA